MLLELGRLCIKTCGRDAMKHCIVVEIIDKNYVVVDGNTRKKKVNILHLEPIGKKFDVKKDITRKEIFEIFKKEGIKIKNNLEGKKPTTKKEQVKKIRKGMDTPNKKKAKIAEKIKSKKVSKSSKK